MNLNQLYRNTHFFIALALIFLLITIIIVFILIGQTTEPNYLQLQQYYVLTLLPLFRYAILMIFILYEMRQIKPLYQQKFLDINKWYSLLIGLINLDGNQILNLTSFYGLLTLLILISTKNKPNQSINLTYVLYGSIAIILIISITFRFFRYKFPRHRLLNTFPSTQVKGILFVILAQIINIIRLVLYSIFTNFNNPNEIAAYIIVMINIVFTFFYLLYIGYIISKINLSYIVDDGFFFDKRFLNDWFTLFKSIIFWKKKKNLRIMLFIVFGMQALVFPFLNQNIYGQIEYIILSILIADQIIFRVVYKCLRIDSPFPSTERFYILNPILHQQVEQQRSEASIQIIKDEELSLHKEYQNQECPICLENMKNSLSKLSCNHIFHTKCIRQWHMLNQYCPLCRKSIKKN